MTAVLRGRKAWPGEAAAWPAGESSALQPQAQPRQWCAAWAPPFSVFAPRRSGVQQAPRQYANHSPCGRHYCLLLLNRSGLVSPETESICWMPLGFCRCSNGPRKHVVLWAQLRWEAGLGWAPPPCGPSPAPVYTAPGAAGLEVSAAFCGHSPRWARPLRRSHCRDSIRSSSRPSPTDGL